MSSLFRRRKGKYFYVTVYQIKDAQEYRHKVNFIASKKGFNEEDIQLKMKNFIEENEKNYTLSKKKKIDGIIYNVSVDASKYVENFNNCRCGNEYSYRFVNIEFVDNNSNLNRINDYLKTLNEFYDFDKAENKIEDMAGFLKSI